MSETNPFIAQIRESGGLRLAVLFGSFFILLILSSIIGNVIGSLPGDPRSHGLLASMVQCILVFCIPAYLLARFSSNKWKEWLELTHPPKIKALFGVIIIYGLSLPAMEWLIEWNSNLHFPEYLSGLEYTFREWEESNETATKILLDAHGVFPVFIGILVIGVLTGFSEELFFRGGLQGILIRSNLGLGISIWLAAILFSTMHFQFFGFLPRLLMGAFFGYLLIWTKSIWVPMFAHALNNSIIVLTAALTGDTSAGLIESTDSSLYFGNPFSVAASVILTVFYLLIFRDWTFKSNKSIKTSWQKSQLPSVSGK